MKNRIVSFLPSATELIYELGAQNELFGVTHECKYPLDAEKKPQIISSVIDSEKLSSKEINDATCRLLNEGKDIFQINEKNLIEANPSIIISQETCEVCAAYTNQLNKAVQILGRRPEIFSMDPHSMDEIIDSVKQLGQLIDKENQADFLISNLKDRIQKIKKFEKKFSPKVLAIEWLDPFFTAGHWVPEMIDTAGGRNLVSLPGEHSRRMSFDEIKNSDPEKIILMPCGFDVKRTKIEYKKILENNSEWATLNAVKNDEIYGVDANSFFSKPSIRTIEGLEILSKIINPEESKEIVVSENSFEKF